MTSRNAQKRIYDTILFAFTGGILLRLKKPCFVNDELCEFRRRSQKKHDPEGILTGPCQSRKAGCEASTATTPDD